MFSSISVCSSVLGFWPRIKRAMQIYVERVKCQLGRGSLPICISIRLLNARTTRLRYRSRYRILFRRREERERGGRGRSSSIISFSIPSGRDDISLLRNIGRKMHIQFKLNSRSSSIVACRCSESNDSSFMLFVDRTWNVVCTVNAIKQVNKNIYTKLECGGRAVCLDVDVAKWRVLRQETFRNARFNFPFFLPIDAHEDKQARMINFIYKDPRNVTRKRR